MSEHLKSVKIIAANIVYFCIIIMSCIYWGVNSCENDLFKIYIINIFALSKDALWAKESNCEKVQSLHVKNVFMSFCN